MSFNIGDKVRVCSEDAMIMFNESEEYDYDIVEDMYNYCDKEFTISFIRGEWIRFEEDDEYYAFHSDLLELAEIKVRNVKPNMCFKRHGYNLMVAGIINGKGEDELNKVRLLMITNEENFGWKVKENDGFFRDEEGIKYYDELRFQPIEGRWISGWWYTFNADKTMEELLFTRINSDKFVVDTLEEEKVVEEEEVKDIPVKDKQFVPTHVLHVADEVNDIAEMVKEAIKRMNVLKELGFDTYLTDNVITCSKDGITYSVVID